MSNNKQSSVKWLQSIELERDLTLADWNQAKEMHKQEIIAAKDDNYVYGEAWEKLGTLGEQYYNETFKSE